MSKSRTLLLSSGAALAVLSLGVFATTQRLPAPPAAVARPAEPPRRAIRAEGRVAAYPGGRATVGAELAAAVRKLHAVEGERVEAGQVIVELADAEPRAMLREAEARRDAALADLAYAEAEAARQERLLPSGATSEEARDRAVRNRDGARAARGVAEATVARLQTTLDKTRIRAPIAGTIIERKVEPGETVVPGTPLFAIADLERLRVEAEVDEFDAGRLELGAEVLVRAEGYDGRWRGTVEELPPTVGPRRLRPEDPGRPQDTRVLLVKVRLDEKSPLRLGQRVELELRSAAPLLSAAR